MPKGDLDVYRIRLRFAISTVVQLLGFALLLAGVYGLFYEAFLYTSQTQLPRPFMNQNYWHPRAAAIITMFAGMIIAWLSTR